MSLAGLSGLSPAVAALAGLARQAHPTATSAVGRVGIEIHAASFAAGLPVAASIASAAGAIAARAAGLARTAIRVATRATSLMAARIGSLGAALVAIRAATATLRAGQTVGARLPTRSTVLFVASRIHAGPAAGDLVVAAAHVAAASAYGSPRSSRRGSATRAPPSIRVELEAVEVVRAAHRQGHSRQRENPKKAHGPCLGKHTFSRPATRQARYCCSRNASAGRKRAAYIAGHTVAIRQTRTANTPTIANSTGRTCTGKREMKYTLGSSGKL